MGVQGANGPESVMHLSPAEPVPKKLGALLFNLMLCSQPCGGVTATSM